MPLGLFLTLAGTLVAPGLRCRYAEIGNRPSILGTADFRILAEIANQNDLVHASRHRHSPHLKSRHGIRALACRPLTLPLAPIAAGACCDRPYTSARRVVRACPLFSTYSARLATVPALFQQENRLAPDRYHGAAVYQRGLLPLHFSLSARHKKAKKFPIAL